MPSPVARTPPPTAGRVVRHRQRARCQMLRPAGQPRPTHRMCAARSRPRCLEVLAGTGAENARDMIVDIAAALGHDVGDVVGGRWHPRHFAGGPDPLQCLVDRGRNGRCLGVPGWPIDWERSDGPMKNTSMPGTARISSMLATAVSCSICTAMSDMAFCCSAKSGILAPSPQRSGRVPAASPRAAPEPNLTAETARRASSAEFTCGTCTPLTPRSITDWMSAASLLRGRAMAVMPDASAAMAISSTSARPMEPCSQSISTQSKPA